MINISDIAVAAYMRPELSIYELLHYYHPFPILERYISEDIVIDTDPSSPLIIKGNTQVFIPLDQIAHSIKYDPKVWSPFGFGPRKMFGYPICDRISFSVSKTLRQQSKFCSSEGSSV